MLSMKRHHGGAPFLQLRVDGRLKFLVVCLVKCGIRRIQSGKRLRDVLCNRLCNNRINSEMRITERVNITRSPCDICWHVHEANAFRRLDSSRLAGLDLWIPRVLQKWRQPAELELGATVNQHIGIAQCDYKARSCIDEVWIFSGFRQDRYVDF